MEFGGLWELHRTNVCLGQGLEKILLVSRLTRFTTIKIEEHMSHMDQCNMWGNSELWENVRVCIHIIVCDNSILALRMSSAKVSRPML